MDFNPQFQALEPDLPMFAIPAVGLILLVIVFAVAFVYALGKLLAPKKNRVQMEAEEKAARELAKRAAAKVDDSEDDDPWTILMIIFGVMLFGFSVIGVLSLVKGLGLGATGKGVAILGFVGFTALALILATLVKKGYGKAVALVAVGIVGAPLALLAVGFVVTGDSGGLMGDIEFAAARVYDEVIDDFGDTWEDGDEAITEAVQEINRELAEIQQEVSKELGAAERGLADSAGELQLTPPRIPVDPNAPSVPEASAAPEEPAAVGQPSEEPAEAAKPTDDLPAVVSVGTSKAVIESAPYESIDAARSDAYEKLREWIVSEWLVAGLNDAGAGWVDTLSDEQLSEGLELTEQISTRELSFGEMQIVTLETPYKQLVTLDWLQEEYAAWQTIEQRSRGVRLVTAAGIGAVALLGAAYGVLSFGENKRAA